MASYGFLLLLGEAYVEFILVGLEKGQGLTLRGSRLQASGIWPLALALPSCKKGSGIVSHHPSSSLDQIGTRFGTVPPNSDGAGII